MSPTCQLSSKVSISSAKKTILTTPQAPCTPNCMQNAPAASPPKLLGRIHRGIKAAVIKTKTMIVSRLPRYWEPQPAMAPPAIAPCINIVEGLASINSVNG